MEEDRVLWDDSYGVSQAVQGHLSDVCVPQQDPAVRRVVESVQETHDRGLAAKN